MDHDKIDSCRLSIPLKQCSIINQDLIDNFTDYRINETTGVTETVKSYKGLPYHEFFDNHTSMKIWINNQITYNKQHDNSYQEDYITFLANSKHLETDYFKGITKETFDKLYNFIMSLDVFQCSFDTFKQARYSDIDICFDFKCDETKFARLKQNILKSAIDTKDFHTSNKFDNSGIWTPTKKDPRNQATPAKPYIKFYSKDIDFTYHSFKFANKYFKPEDYQDLVRFEATVKNYQHKRRLGLHNKSTIWDLLKTTDLRNLIQSIAMPYFKKAQYINNQNLSTMDKLLIDNINKLLKYGCPVNEIYSMYNRFDVKPKARQRLLQKYQDLYSQDLINRQKIEADNITSSVFEHLGIQEPDEDEDKTDGQ